MSWKKRPTETANASQPVLTCSFCKKDEHQVKKLIAGPPTVFICDECVEVCNDIIADEVRIARAQELKGEKPTDGLADVSSGGPAVSCVLCRMPIAGRGLLIQNRGVLCFGCIGEIDDAIADSGEPEP